MGIYLNPGNDNFTEMSSNKYYVDKTKMLSVLNSFIDEGNKYICVSRPRRFGKTMTGNMISSYYSKGCDSLELFSKFNIAKEAGFDNKLNKYNVIKIDMNSEYQNTLNKERLILGITNEIRNEIKKEYPQVEITEDDSLAQCILRVYNTTKETFVIIMDEYDVLVRERASEDLFLEYLSFLNGLFKSDTLRPAISLAYLTGILPVVRDRVQSKLNNFREYTIFDAGELAEYIGFTDDEVKKLCSEYSLDYDDCRRWYDGYRQRGFDLYNPESVIRSIERGEFAGYWGMTSTYKVIVERINHEFAGIKEDVIRMISGESVDVNVGKYINTMDSFKTKDDVYTYLIHIGYLAFDKSRFNALEGTCRIPNLEIMHEWEYAVEEHNDYSVTNSIIELSKKLLSDTLTGNENAVAQALDISHIHVTSNRSYNNEDALASAIYLSYIYALNEYTCVKEVTAGKGFADVIYIPVYPDIPAMIIELKRNGNTGKALEQIKEKRYFDCLSHYQGRLLLVAINYDEHSKTHTCNIEEFEKANG